MTLHPPKAKWAPPVLREERSAKPEPRPARQTTGFTLGALFGAEIRADRAEKRAARAAQDRRAELNDMGFRPIGGA